MNLININKNNNLDKYIIFTTRLQINLISKCTQIFIDGTFKTCPKNFYQIINIGGYYPEIDGIVPIFMIPQHQNHNIYIIKFLKMLLK